MTKEQIVTVRVQPTEFAGHANQLSTQGYVLTNSFVIDNKVFGIFTLNNKPKAPVQKPKKKPKKKA